jgi:hypothetical protein
MWMRFFAAIVLSATAVTCIEVGDMTSLEQEQIAPPGGWPPNAADLAGATKCKVTVPAGITVKYMGQPPCPAEQDNTDCGVTLRDGLGGIVVCINKNPAACSAEHACCTLEHELEHAKQWKEITKWCKANKPAGTTQADCEWCVEFACGGMNHAEPYAAGCKCERKLDGTYTGNACSGWDDGCLLAKSEPSKSVQPRCDAVNPKIDKAVCRGFVGTSMCECESSGFPSAVGSCGSLSCNDGKTCVANNATCRCEGGDCEDDDESIPPCEGDDCPAAPVCEHAE